MSGSECRSVFWFEGESGLAEESGDEAGLSLDPV